MAIVQADKSTKKEIKTKRAGKSAENTKYFVRFLHTSFKLVHVLFDYSRSIFLYCSQLFNSSPIVLQESIEQYKQKSSVFQSSPNMQKKKGSKKKKTKRSVS